ncbi:MAG: cytochrome PufQ [Pseudomonadota bacterium]
MTDLTSNDLPRERRRSITWEYRFYFTVIFMITLPWALVSWAFGLARPDSEDARLGLFGRAKRRADIITPMIFSA